MAKVAKMKFFRDFDKEEAWLNRMAADGLLLTKAGLRYQFEPVTPGSAVVRVDYQPSMPQSDFDDYLTLFADSGDRKSTRLNSSHVAISYAVFCLKKKKKN